MNLLAITLIGFVVLLGASAKKCRRPMRETVDKKGCEYTRMWLRSTEGLKWQVCKTMCDYGWYPGNWPRRGPECIKQCCLDREIECCPEFVLIEYRNATKASERSGEEHREPPLEESSYRRRSEHGYDLDYDIDPDRA